MTVGTSPRIGRIEATPQGASTPLRGLTHSLDLSKEGLAVNATHKPHPTHSGSPSKYQDRARAKFAAHTDRVVSPWAIITTSCDFHQCLRVSCMSVLEPVKIAYASGQCVYCGEPSSGYDHLMPRAWTGEQQRRQVGLVPCCRHCNSVINDAWAVSVSERRAICHERLRRRNKKLLESPDLKPWEYLALGHVLRESAKAHAVKKQRLLARLNWPLDPDYDRRAFERSGIPYAEERGIA